MAATAQAAIRNDPQKTRNLQTRKSDYITSVTGGAVATGPL